MTDWLELLFALPLTVKNEPQDSSLPLDKGAKETPQSPSLLENSEEQTCANVCEAPCTHGCLQSSWCQGSWWDGAGAWGTCSRLPSRTQSGGWRRRVGGPLAKHIIGGGGPFFSNLHIFLTNHQLPCVGKVHQQCKGQGIHIMDCDFRQTFLN